MARLEGRVSFEELLGRFSDIEPTGEPVRVRSNLSNAYKMLPVWMVGSERSAAGPAAGDRVGPSPRFGEAGGFG
jgi:hypothetical protein